MNKLISILLFVSLASFGQQQGTLINPKAINGYTVNGKMLMTATDGTTTGVPTWTVPNFVVKTQTLTINGISKTFTSTPTFTTPLSQVLGVDNATSGHNIILTDGDAIVSSSSKSNVTYGSNGEEFQATTDNGGFQEAWIYNSPNEASIGYGDFNYLKLRSSDVSLDHTTIINLNAPSVKKNSDEIVAATETQTLTNKTITSGTLTGVTTASNTNFNGYVNQAKSSSAASSSTVDLSAFTGNYAHITGTTTINSFGTVQAGAERTLVFDGVLTITSNTASIILPNNLSILTNTNDVGVFRSEGSGVWRLVSYQMADNSSISYSPTWAGFSVTPSGGSYTYILTGKLCYVNIAPSTSGTTNATTCTVTLPFNAKYNSSGAGGFCVDGTTKTVFWSATAGSNVLTLSPTVAGTAWLNAGGAKRANLSLVFEIQ